MVEYNLVKTALMRTLVTPKEAGINVEEKYDLTPFLDALNKGGSSPGGSNCDLHFCRTRIFLVCLMLFNNLLFLMRCSHNYTILPVLAYFVKLLVFLRMFLKRLCDINVLCYTI